MVCLPCSAFCTHHGFAQGLATEAVALAQDTQATLTQLRNACSSSSGGKPSQESVAALRDLCTCAGRSRHSSASEAESEEASEDPLKSTFDIASETHNQGAHKENDGKQQGLRKDRQRVRVCVCVCVCVCACPGGCTHTPKYPHTHAQTGQTGQTGTLRRTKSRSKANATKKRDQQPQLRATQQAKHYEPVTEEQFLGLSELVRGRAKLADVNKVYQTLFDHFSQQKKKQSRFSPE